MAKKKPTSATPAPDPLEGLTAKQRKFVEVYAGNATDAARLAGYAAGSDNALAQAGRYLLRNPQVVAAIRAREGVELEPLIATRQERQEFWTQLMNDERVEEQHRLKASELLGRSNLDFADKVVVEGKVTLEQLVLGAHQRKPEEPT